jgi:hypothetical protein
MPMSHFPGPEWRGPDLQEAQQRRRLFKWPMQILGKSYTTDL